MSILRRTFFTSASAGIASACFGRTATPGQFTGKIRKAVKYHMVAGNGSVEDKFRMVKDLGFDGIEPRVAAGPKNRELVKAFAAAREKTGLPIHGMVNGNRPNLIEAIDQAKFLGANSVLHVVGYDRKISYSENYRRTQELIRSAMDHAEKQNVKILLENVWATFLIEPLGMARFVDELDSPQVKVYFDVGNVVRWGYPQHWIEVLGDRIEKLDIKEYDLNIAMNEGMRKGFDRPLGGGSVDWESVRQELVKINYEGWATAEVRGGDRQRLADIATQMDDVLSL